MLLHFWRLILIINWAVIKISQIEASSKPIEDAPTSTAVINNSVTVDDDKMTTMTGAATASRQRLLAKLATFYNKQQNVDNLPTHVMVKLYPIKIQDLNEKSEVLETTIRLQITWQDSRLVWDAAMFGNFTELVVPGNSLWQPDIGVFNSVSDIYHVVQDTRFGMKVEHTGRVWWHVTGIVKTYCKLYLLYFPFDQQNCKIIIESPTFDTNFMKLTTRSNAVDLSMYLEGETWELMSIRGYNTTNRVGVKTVFSRVEFVIHIQRAKIYHMLNVVLPACFLSMVQVMFFLLPATHPQRVGSSTTTLLSVVVLHSVAISQLPKTSTDVPLLAIYIILVTFVSGLSVCTSILVAKFTVYADQKIKMPIWLRKIPRPFRRTAGATDASSASTAMIQGPQQDETATRTKSPDVITSAEIVKDLQFVYDGDEKTMKQRQDDSSYLFSTWSDFSWLVDLCLMVIALVIAVASPLVIFVILPNLIVDTSF